MFATLESFSIFFFTGLALIVLGVIFEEKLIAIENKIAKKIKSKKEAKKSCHSKAKTHSKMKCKGSKPNSAKRKVS